MTTKTKGQDGDNRLTPKTSDIGNVNPLAQELSHIVKPEIDLQTWFALGQSAKPSVADRRQKWAWRRADA